MKSIFCLLYLFLTFSLGAQDNARLSFESANIINFSIEEEEFRLEMTPMNSEIKCRVDGMPYQPPAVNSYFANDLSSVVRIHSNNEIEIIGFFDDKIYSLHQRSDGSTSGNITTLDFSDFTRFPQCEGALEAPPVPPVLPQEIPESGCFKVHYDVGPSVYAAFSNDIDSAINYVSMTWDVVRLIYAREGVPLAVVSADFFTNEDAYPLEIFQSFEGLNIVSNRNADLGLPGEAQLRHGLGIHPGVGGVAYLGGFNPTQNIFYKACFSAIRKESIVDGLNVYAWTIMVQAHEMGHSADLYHTHECEHDVDGDGIYNEAIDGCVLLQGGGCEPGPVPEDGGTIMSYCHLNQVGTNIAKGFHPLNTVVMLQNSALWGSICDIECLGATGIGATATATSVTVTWTGSASEWIVTLSNGQMATVSGTTYTFTGLSPQTVYTATVAPACNSAFIKSTQIRTKCTVTIPGIGYDDDLTENTWTEVGNANWVWTEGQYKTNGDDIYGDNIDSYLMSPCFNTEGYEYATVEVTLALDLEQSSNGQGDFFSWDWVMLMYSFDGVTFFPVGSFPDFYNSDRGFAGSTTLQPLEVWGGTASQKTYSQEISFLTGESYLIFALRMKTDTNTGQDGVTFSNFYIRGIEECTDSGTVDTVVIDNTDYETIDSLEQVVSDQDETIDSLVSLLQDCDTTIVDPPACELSVLAPCVDLYTKGKTCTEVSPVVISNGVPEYQWSNGSTQPSTIVCIGDELSVTVTVGECVETVDIVPIVVNNQCGNPRTGAQTTICFDNQTVCVNDSEVQGYLDQGATLGACGSGCSTGRVIENIPQYIYPNPTTGIIYMDYYKGIEMQYFVFDINGKTVMSGYTYEGKIDFGLQPNGIYFLDVYANTFVPQFSTRVVVSR